MKVKGPNNAKKIIVNFTCAGIRLKLPLLIDMTRTKVEQIVARVI